MIGVMGDSHDNLGALRRAIAVFQEAGCRLVIHTGDFVAPFTARELATLNCPLKAVFGNCDGEKIGLEEAIRPFGEIRQAPLVWAENNLRFLLTHLHHEVESLAHIGRYDVIIFGHTHRPEIRRVGQTLLINPGETGGWLTGKSTVVLLDPLRLEADLVYL